MNMPGLHVVDARAEDSRRAAAVDWLMGRINYERTLDIPYGEQQLKLDRMRTLLVRLGQPEAELRIVHVAGTKGKGSTAAMIAAILSSAGFQTGVFSSPHLQHIEERFMVGGMPCAAEELVALVNELRPVVERMDAEVAAAGDPLGGPTYFEIVTAIALVHFAKRRVDAAVLEVGLGGRLDSTNICMPAVSVITSVGFDHMKQLGDSLASIAREKAGIIKPGVPVVSGVLEPDAQATVARAATDRGCRLIQLGRDFQFQYRPGALDFEYGVAGQELRLEEVALSMPGAHQGMNAAVALATVTELRNQGWCISADAMRDGLASVQLPGRVELVPGTPTVVVDTAHNRPSARALVAALAELALAGRKSLILAASCDKDVAAIVRELVPHFNRVFVTEYQDNPRAVDAEQLARIVRSEGFTDMPLTHCATPGEAWEQVCRTAEPGELVVIAGSFYLAAELRPAVLARQSVAAAD